MSPVSISRSPCPTPVPFTFSTPTAPAPGAMWYIRRVTVDKVGEIGRPPRRRGDRPHRRQDPFWLAANAYLSTLKPPPVPAPAPADAAKPVHSRPRRPPP